MVAIKTNGGGGGGDGGEKDGDQDGGQQQQVYIDPITGQKIAFVGKEPPLVLPPGAVWEEVKPGVWAIKATGGGEDGGGTTSGSGGSVSIGGGGSAGFNPEDAKKASMRSAYFQLWGEYPTDGYLNKFVDEMSVPEFIDSERHKPAFLRTDTAHQGADGYVSLMRQWGAI